MALFSVGRIRCGSYNYEIFRVAQDDHVGVLCPATTRLRSRAIPGQRPGHASWRYFVLAATPGGMRCRPYNYEEAAPSRIRCGGYKCQIRL